MSKGLIYSFTGDGKGKTSAALGVSVRMSCNQGKVAWVAWYKNATWQMSEQKLPESLPIEMYFLGEGFYLPEDKMTASNIKIAPLTTGGKVFDKNSPQAHVQAAQLALAKAQSLLESQNYDLVVCDEIHNAVYDGLLSVENVLDLIEKRGKTHLVITGRNAHDRVIAICDLASEIKKIKHPYDKGVSAVKGLDF